MNRVELERILQKLPELTIVVFGDFFLDRYFVIESSLAERSIETGLIAHQVVAKRLTPGAAGTVVSNLKALGVGEVICIGAVGADGEGYELKAALDRIGAIHEGWLVESEELFTPCYSKPMLRENGRERELERIDIKNRALMPASVQDEMLSLLRKAIPRAQGVIIADQVQERDFGVVTDRAREELAQLADLYREKAFCADSRLRIAEFRRVITKPNMYEAVNAIRGSARVDSAGGSIEDFTLADAKACAAELRKLTERTVFMTAQEEGIYVFDDDVVHVPAVRVEGEIDPVGAGDSCTAGIVSALCAGATKEDAALLGNIVASITVQKLGQTGTATPAEVLARFEENQDAHRGR
jgi:bifunctional ADP-heptose synthase (sugar kinase/adenylyltransferase)